MKFSKIIIVCCAILLGLIILYSVSSGPDNQEYGKAILKERAEKNNFMKNSDASPFGESRNSFDSLKYFTPNLKYKVVADLQSVENKKG